MVIRGVGAVLAWLGALFAVVAGIVAGLRLSWRTFTRLRRFLDDWFGTDDRPGMVKRVQSMTVELAQQRADIAQVKSDLAETRAQLHPNGGSTVADAVRRIESAVGSTPPPPPDGH